MSSADIKPIAFTKMQGAGNDYIYVNGFERPDVWNAIESPNSLDVPRLARDVANRHFGVGGDGLILIGPSQTADARMRMFNADGSEAQMCGNGIRCVAKFLYDHGIQRREKLRIETGAGVLELLLHVDGDTVDGDTVDRVRVDMGKPILEADKIPTTFSGERVVDQPLTVGDKEFLVTCVSMGNPHCITFVDELTDELVLTDGPRIERDPRFPERVNAEFVQVISPDEIRMRVWERGSGETLACGTGASAVCVAGVLTGKTNRKILAHLVGGDLELEWAADDHVFMTGPAVEVFSGEWEVKPLGTSLPISG